MLRYLWLFNIVLLFGSGLLMFLNPYLSTAFMHHFTSGQESVVLLLIGVASTLVLGAIAVNFLYHFKRTLHISILAFVVAGSVYIIGSNQIHCYSFLEFCKNGWHYEKNFLGQRVDVHYKINLFGKVLPNSFTGCGYDGSPTDYDRLVLTVPGVHKLEENNTQIVYQFLNDQKGYLHKNTKPYPDEIVTRAIAPFIYKGTRC
ncbi:hypothetical protein HGA88_05745 [Candidatus Roizmanbacteria bacterium]|nr:hypothetical protein [Candidatus Roizmanbacteria bacterium]